MINKNASKVGTIQFNNGNKVAIWMGHNTNTGEDIIWQVLNGGKATRVTGRNIHKFVGELNQVLNEGEAKWVECDEVMKGYL